MGKSAKGDCFVVAGHLAVKYHGNPDVRIVHALVMGQGKLEGVRFAHAYVVEGDMVIDQSNGKDVRMVRALYEAVGNVRKAEAGAYVEYTPEETVQKMVKFRHYGPWDLDTSKCSREDQR